MADGLKFVVDKVTIPQYRGKEMNLGKPTWMKMGKVVSKDIIGRIKLGRQADGRAIKANAPSTTMAKMRSGKGPERANVARGPKRLFRGAVRSLIDVERRFIKTGKTGSFSYEATKNKAVIHPGDAELLRLNKLVQKAGYVGWFAISDQGKRIIRAIVHDRVLALLNKIAAKSK